MSERRLRNILEDRPPELNADAARRIEARVRERIEGGPRRRGGTWALALAPALLVLIALLWLLPRGGEPSGYLLLDENQFVEYLGRWERSGGDLSELLEIDCELDGEDWSREQREEFLDELEDFSLDAI